MMRHLPTAVLALVIVASVVFASLALFERPAPSGLVVESPVHDFGIIPPGRVQHRFTLVNRSKYPVQLLHSVKSCGCTSVDMPAKQLAPGESAVAVCEFDSRGQRGPASASVTIVYRPLSPDKPREELALHCLLRATVDPVVDVEPTALQFDLSHPKRAKLQVSSSEQDVRITRVLHNHYALSTQIGEDGRTVDVSFDPTRWLDGEGRVTIQLHTSYAAESVIDVPVRISGHRPKG